jgi:hypothetical protein
LSEREILWEKGEEGEEESGNEPADCYYTIIAGCRLGTAGQGEEVACLRDIILLPSFTHPPSLW